MDQKEKLTEATILALQGKLTEQSNSNILATNVQSINNTHEAG